MDALKFVFVSVNLTVDILVKLLLLLNLGGKGDRNLPLLEDVLLCEVNRIFDSLCVDVAVLDGLVSREKIIQFNDHGLHHLNSELDRGLEFEDQLRQLVLKLLGLGLVGLP